MSDFGTDKNTQFAEDKAKNKFDELAGSACCWAGNNPGPSGLYFFLTKQPDHAV